MLKKLQKWAAERKPQGKKGFTLVELIIVIIILVILMAIAIPSVAGYVDRANRGRAAANARTAYMAVCVLVADSVQLNGTATLPSTGAVQAEAGVTGTIALPSLTGNVLGGTFIYTEGGHTFTYTIATRTWTES